MTTSTQQDPMDLFRQLWGNMGFKMPGMVAPSFDPDDLEKQITDLKAVEGWLRMNISMLQMTIQGLEMQHSTLSTVKNFSDSIRASSGNPAIADAADGDNPSVGETLQRAALWPWEVIQQVQEGVQKHLEEEVDRAESAIAAAAKAAAKSVPKPAAKAAPKKTAPKAAAKKPAR